MSQIGIALILSYALYIDARLLQKQDQRLYQTYLKSDPFQWVAAFLIHVGISFLFYLWIEKILLFPLIVVSVYLFRRKPFQTEFQKQISKDDVLNFSHLARISNASAVILKWALCLGFLISFIAAVPGLKKTMKSSSEIFILLQIIPTTLVIFFISRLRYTFPYEPFAHQVGFLKPRAGLWKMIVIAIVFAVIFAAISSIIILKRDVTPSTPMSQTLQSISSPISLVSFMILALFIAPLVEELIFRGYFFNVLELSRGTLWAVVGMAAVFTVLHVGQYWGDWAAVVMVGSLGLGLSGLRALSGSVVPGIVAHYSYNILVATIPVIVLMVSNNAYIKYTQQYQFLTDAQKEQLLIESIENRPEFIVSYNELAWIYARQGRKLEKALELINRALEHDAKNPAYLDTKAEVLYRLGRNRKAAEIEKNLVEKFPHNKGFQKQLQKFRRALRSDRN